MHQLAGTLRDKGINASIMYYGGPHQGRVVVQEGIIRGTHSTEAQTPECYRHYGVHVAPSCELRESLCIVIPEVLQQNFQSLKPAQVALWWLSVDNALELGRPMREPEKLKKWISSIPLHLTQSVYAAAWLNANGQHDHWMLTDYTDSEFTRTIPVLGERTRQVLFNPRKGAPLANRLREQMPDWQFVPLQNFTKAQVRSLMQTSRYYIDFGHHPGKDRLPREAAASGCVVMTLRAGAAQFFEDVPIDSIYKFTQPEVDNGILNESLRKIDTDYTSHWQAQQRYRSRIRQEKQIFDAEALSIFSA
jgi:hypothetical protein